MGPPLALKELAAWCRSRGLSEADAEQLRAVFAERDNYEADFIAAQALLAEEFDELGDDSIVPSLARIKDRQGAQVATLTAERDGAVAEAAALRRERDVARAERTAAEAKAAGTTAAIPEIVAQSVEAERELCAEAVDALKPEPSETATHSQEREAGVRWDVLDDAVAAIRARSKP